MVWRWLVCPSFPLLRGKSISDNRVKVQAIILQNKQKLVQERVAKFDKDNIESWRVFHEEEEIRKRERQKKMDRQQRKLDIKKEKVV